MTTVIVITAKRNGFRRCGVAHSDQPTTWQQDDFTDEQWEELIKEPQLFLAVEERDLDLGLEQHHAFTSSTALPEAPSTFQIAESQAPEAIVAPVVAQVVAAIDAALGHDQPGATAPGTPGVASVGDAGLLIDNQDALAGNVAQDAQSDDDQPDAAKASVPPSKAKTGKAKAGQE